MEKEVEEIYIRLKTAIEENEGIGNITSVSDEIAIKDSFGNPILVRIEISTLGWLQSQVAAAEYKVTEARAKIKKLKSTRNLKEKLGIG